MDVLLEVAVHKGAHQQDVEAAVHPEERDGEHAEAAEEGIELVHPVYVDGEERREDAPAHRGNQGAGELVEEVVPAAGHEPVRERDRQPCYEEEACRPHARETEDMRGETPNR